MGRLSKKEEAEKSRVILAANNALTNLKAAKRSLDGAYFLGIIDIVGGMYVISGIKLAKIEAAKKHIREAMKWLEQFRRETDDNDYVNTRYMKLGFLGSSLDLGMDGFVTDIYSQVHIANLRSRVSEAIRRMEAIMRHAGIMRY